jgi:AraC family transcriptional regulator
MAVIPVNLLAQMNEAMEYLEAHLTDEISSQQMATLAGCSEYHFRRIFSYLAGLPLGGNIRCRRLTLAGTLLRQAA